MRLEPRFYLGQFCSSGYVDPGRFYERGSVEATGELSHQTQLERGSLAAMGYGLWAVSFEILSLLVSHS